MYVMRVGESPCLRLESSEKEPMSGARILLYCSNTTAHADPTLESGTSVPLSLESYVSLFPKDLLSIYQQRLEILPMFSSHIRGFIKVMNGFHLIIATE